MHLAGLKEIVALRGGLENLSWPLISQILTCAPFLPFIWHDDLLIIDHRCDVKIATTSLTRPLFPFVRFHSQSTTVPRQLVPSELALLGTSLQGDLAGGFFSNSMIETIRGLRNVAIFAELCRRGQCPTEGAGEGGYYDNENLYMEHRLLLIPFTEHSQVQDCCRLACLLFINTGLWRGFPPRSAIIRRLIVATKAALQRLGTGMDSLWWTRAHSHILLWALFLGAYASAGQIERPWFISHLASCTIALGLTRWIDARALLVKSFYLDDPYQEGFKVVWGEAERVVRALT